MSKKLIVTLVIIALTVIVLLFNMGERHVSVNLLFTTWKAAPAFVFLLFTAIGTLIGILLK